ncbi:CYTOCHROME P450 82C3-RELATED [Salix koriyanagi]|uniref:CYTOCHROME P450 82C3-RELATED n=1 Tax=Salix koriyanagi TaxID=2511006 RepID=A0A9Q1AMN1_9ROSI|nr:CYTOCHROME P450 82C3-RELATED [Salix koriyanagi]
MPERFLTDQANVEVLGQHFELIPFGSGRRSCPGITLALQVLHLTVARLLQGFDMKTPTGESVDMTERLSITLPKMNPLEILITPHLSPELYSEC